MSRVDLGDPDLYTAMIARLMAYRAARDGAVPVSPERIADAWEQYQAALGAWEATLTTEQAGYAAIVASCRDTGSGPRRSTS